MLYKIVWKDFKRECRNYLPLLLSITLSVIVANATLYANITGLKLVQKGLLEIYDIRMMMLSLLAVIILIWNIVTYALNHYVGRRSKSYQLFQILGIQDKAMKKLLFFEYCGGAVIAIMAGMMISVVTLWAIGEAAQRMLRANILGISQSQIIFSSLSISLVILLGIIILKYVNISKVNITKFTRQEPLYRDRQDEKSIYIYFGAGTLLVAVGIWFLSRFFIEYKLIQQIGIFFYIMGLAIVFLFGMQILIAILKRNETYYYSRLIILSNLYKQFRKNSKILTGVLLINLLLFTVLFHRLWFNMPINEGSKDPFDIIWLAGESDKKEVNEMEHYYNAKTMEIHYAPLFIHTMEGSGPFVGISHSQYQSLGGDSTVMKDDEVLFVAQSNGQFFFSDKATLSFGDKFEYETNRSKERTFRTQGWENTALIGGNFDIAVMSDRVFREMSVEAGGEKIWMAQKVPDGNRISAEQSAFAKKGRGNIWASEGIYGKEIERQIDLTQKIIMEILMGVVCASLMSFNIYFIGVRFWSRIPEWIEQSEFLECQGMRRREYKNIVKKEMNFFVFFPYVIAVLGWIFYAFMDCLNMGEIMNDMEWAVRQWMYIGIMILSWGVIQYLYYCYLRRFVSKQLDVAK